MTFYALWNLTAKHWLTYQPYVSWENGQWTKTSPRPRRFAFRYEADAVLCHDAPKDEKWEVRKLAP